jgi:hypothetical protein
MDTRSTHQYQPTPERTAQILRESAIVARAIARHRREAALQARTEEAQEMEVLHRGVCRMALEVVQANQPISRVA